METSLRYEKKYASTWKHRDGGCLVCEDERHKEKIFFWKHCKELKKSMLWKSWDVKCFLRCLGCHGQDDETKVLRK